MPGGGRYRIRCKTVSASVVCDPDYAVIDAAASGSSDAMPVLTSVASSSTITDAKIGDLPRYRNNILSAIRDNPGKSAIALATILERNHSVRVHFQALRKFIAREKLYEVASPSAPAPSTPIGRGTGSMQTSPVRASPRRRVNVKIRDLPLYTHRIVKAIKSNPGRKSGWLAGELSKL